MTFYAIRWTMAKYLFAYIAILVCVAGAVSGVCHTSGDCGQDACCRDSSGKVLSRQEGFMIFPNPTGSGTCSAGKAQKGEACDSHCQCDTGLECYRPMSGICCPPMLCYDATYVQKQKEYWAHCSSNPNCSPPP